MIEGGSGATSTEPRLNVLDIDHVNQLVEGIDVARDHYERIYGVEVKEVWRERTGPYDNFIVKVGTMTLEVFSPVDPDHSFGRQHRRFGNCWQGCLWRVPDLVEALAVCRARDLPVVDVNLERGWAFTDPRSTFLSVQLEDLSDWDKTSTPNAAGILGLHGITVAVPDVEVASDFFSGLLVDAPVLFREDLPALGGRAVALKLGPYVLELQGPTGDGTLAAFLERYRPRVRTATWLVESLNTTSARLEANGVRLEDGDRPGTLAIAPSDNLGIAMQFVEER